MSPLIHELVSAAGSSPAASILTKVTFSTAIGLAGARLAKRSSAAARHALLAATFGVLAAMPIASVIFPPIRVAMPAAAEPTLPAGRSGPVMVSPAQAGRVGDATIVSRSTGPSLLAVSLAGWGVGAALFLLPVVVGMWQVRCLRRSAVPWRQGQSMADELAFAAGIRRGVEVLLHGALPGPMTCGVVHPTIALPEDAQNWEAEDLNRALVHELEHVRRFDWATHCLARVACAAYWFHPLVWIAWRRLALEAERSCDDAVLGRSEATSYADQLVGLARRLGTKSPLLAMANRADLAARVGAVLDSGQRRGRAGALRVALALVAAAVLVIALSPLTMVAAPPQAAVPDAAPAPVARFASTTMLVVVNVIVSDRDGRVVEGLSANDFQVTEDGVPQTVSFFEFQKLAGEPQGSAVSSYYLVGYYSTNQNADGGFQKIQITGRNPAMVKLEYRPGHNAMKAADGLGHSVGQGSPGVTPPVLIFKKDPAYSEEARKAKYQGTVLLGAAVDANGRVTNLRVIRSLGLNLDEKAMEAVKEWRFKPAMSQGRPVAAQVQVEANFRLL